jgi:hypothetical protein
MDDIIYYLDRCGTYTVTNITLRNEEGTGNLYNVQPNEIYTVTVPVDEEAPKNRKERRAKCSSKGGSSDSWKGNRK